jgi:hypothetical protein
MQPNYKKSLVMPNGTIVPLGEVKDASVAYLKKKQNQLNKKLPSFEEAEEQ